MNRLRSVITIDRRTIDADQMPEFVNLLSIPSFDTTGASERVMSYTIDSHKLKLTGGEVLISRLNPRKPRVLRVPSVLSEMTVASTEFIALKPQGIDPRYLRYLLLSEAVRQDLDSQVRSATRSHQRVEPQAVLDLGLPVNEGATQRRIADFLDNRVARIDKIIAARRDQDAACSALLTSTYDRILSVWPTVPVRYLTRTIGVGIVIQPARLYTESSDGVPALRGLNVQEGFFSLKELVRITPDGHTENRRSALHCGDVVVVRTGDAGTAAAIPPELDGWNCIDLVIARPDLGVDSNLLAFTLNASKRSTRSSAASSGSIQQHLGADALAGLTVHFPEMNQQEAVLEELTDAKDSAEAMACALQKSVSLLTEYKQSLITAAVTGQLDVTTAGDRIPG